MSSVDERINELFLKAGEAQKEHPEWRWGQSIFNTLAVLDPEAADALWSTPFDCFYRDDHVRFTLAFVRTFWTHYRESAHPETFLG